MEVEPEVSLLVAFIMLEHTCGRLFNHSQTGPPDLALAELWEVGSGPTVDEFFSRNFLLMFTALKRFGWLVDEPLDPNCTREGREGLEADFASAGGGSRVFE